MAEPRVRITVEGDASDAVDALEDVVRASQDTEAHIDSAGRAAGAWADKMDFAGGAAAKLAGASGDIGGSLAGVGLISEDTAAHFDKFGQILMGVAGIADVATTAAALYTAAQEAGGLAAARSAVATVAGRVATIASTAATGVATAAQWAWNAAMSANPIGLIILGIIALVAVIVLLWKNSETFRRIVTAAWEGIKVAAVAVFDFLKGYFLFIFGIYKAIFTAVWDVIKGATLAVWDGIKAYFTFIFGIYSAIFRAGLGAVMSVWSGVTWLYDKAVAVFGAIKNFVSQAIEGWMLIIRAGVDKARAVWAGIVAMADKVLELREKMLGYLRGLVDNFLNIGQDIMRGLANGIERGLNWVRDKVRGLGGLIPDWLKGVLGIHSPSRVMAALGRDVMRGLTAGMDAQVPALRSTLGDVTDTIMALDAHPAVTVTGSAQLDGAPLPNAVVSAAGLGQQVNVTVQVPPASDPAEVGRQIVKALRSYETSFGRTVLVG